MEKLGGADNAMWLTNFIYNNYTMEKTVFFIERKQPAPHRYECWDEKPEANKIERLLFVGTVKEIYD